ncbi:unnamed protein product [Closterium sp. NIES-54]
MIGMSCCQSWNFLSTTHTWLNLERGDCQPFSFAQLPWLKVVELDVCCPQFELMLLSGVLFSCLERLLLKGSSEMGRLPDDIGERLPRLRHLTLWGCKNVSELPVEFASLSCLRELTIFSCDMVSLLENYGELPALKVLTLNHRPISSLPYSFYQLTSLETLYLPYCNAIFELPARFGFLTVLNTLCIINSPHLKLPDDISALTNLHTFRLTQNSPQQLLPSSFTQLSSLTRLELIECTVAQLPEDVGKLSNLRVLIIQSCSKIQRLSDSLTDLVNLQVLKPVDCDSLISIPTSLRSLGGLKDLALAKLSQLVQVSTSLLCSLEILSIGSSQRLTPLLELPSLPRLIKICLTSVGLMHGLAVGMSLSSLLTIHSTGCVRMFPEGLGLALWQLRRLQIHRAIELTELTDSFTDLQSLTFVEIHGPNLSSLPDGIGALSRLRQLNLENCSSLTHLPASLTQLSCLQLLNLCCTLICSLTFHLGQLSQLKELNLDGCTQLAALP